MLDRSREGVGRVGVGSESVVVCRLAEYTGE